MGWSRQQFEQSKKFSKRPRHARVPLTVVQCVDCFRPLSSTYPATASEYRCRSCYSSYVVRAFSLTGLAEEVLHV